MARVFITGSSDGLGLMVGQLLADQGHRIVLHARSDARAARREDRPCPRPKRSSIGDLSSIAATKDLATQVNALGPFDAVIHNAAVGYREGHRLTSDGLPHVFAINTLAPYILTALIDRPKRLVYLSSGMHERAQRQSRRHSVAQAALGWIVGLRREQAARRHARFHRRAPLAQRAVECGDARLGPDQDGRRRAPDDIAQAHLTQAWLATSDDSEAKTTGGYFYHLKRREPNREAREESRCRTGSSASARRFPGSTCRGA